MNSHVYTELLEAAIRQYGDKACLHIKRDGLYQSWSYSDFHKELNRCASALRHHGLKRGTNAVVIGENTPEWIIAYHSIILTGACTVPVDPNIPPSEIETIIRITEAKIVFCSRVYAVLFRSLKEKYHFIDRVVILDPKSDEKEQRFQQFIDTGNEEKDAFTMEKFEPDDPMVIIFTSGTTGHAKGVVLMQKNYTVVSRYGIPRMKVTSQDTVLAVLPLHHVFGFAACIAGPILGGLDVVFVPYVKGPLILEALRDKGVTFLPAVPKMISLFYESIMHNVKKKGPIVSSLFAGMKTVSATAGDFLGNNFRRNLFSTVHKGFGGKLWLVVSGGAALGKKYWHGFRLLGFTIVEGYGLTETFGPITLCPGETARLGSVGPVLQENEMTICEPNDAGIGEVALRGCCVFKGYYKNDTLTSEVFDKDGWFHTGDLGRLDKDGYLYLVGRKKDMIVLDTGKNVYPDELEDYYSSSTVIEEIGVFGVRQEEGEIVAAAIVPSKEIRKSHSVTEATDLLYEELVRLGKDLPVYRRITDFVTMYQPLPRTTTKKLKKMELLKLYNSIKRKSGSQPVPGEQLSVLEMALMETPEYLGVVSAIASVSPKTDPHIINPRSQLEIDLGLDSLKRIELLSDIERRFSLTIPEEVFDKMETVEDIVSLVKDCREEKKEVSVEKVMDIKERILSDMMECRLINREPGLMDKAVDPLFRLARPVSGSNVSGLEHLAGISYPVVFASNHPSPGDAFRILSVLPSSVRLSTYVIGDKETLGVPVLPLIFSKNIHRPGNDRDPIEILKLSLSILKCRNCLLMFPEGSASRSERIGAFKSGIGLISRETGATIVPVRIHNKKGGTHWSIIFGKPFTYNELAARGIITQESPADVVADHIRTLISAM